MNSRPLVSIAVCTYNGEKYLRQQLDSLLAQDYPNLEIIAVDDCSSDSTFSILQQYQEKSPIFRAYQNKNNLGFIKNFEKAISLCKGEFISLCDQDDVWFSEKLTKLVDAIGCASLIYSVVQLMDADGNLINKKFPNTNRLQGHCHLSLLFANCVTGHACLVRKSTIDLALPFPKGISVHDHWIAFVAAAQNGIVAHPEVLSLYRFHGENVLLGKKSRKKERKRKKFIEKKQINLKFIKSLVNSPFLKEEDQDLIKLVYDEYEKTLECSYNYSLEKIIRQNPSVLDIFNKRDSAMYYICNGFSKFFFTKRKIVNAICCVVPSQQLRHNIRAFNRL